MADQLGVAHDRVGTEVRQVLGLLLGAQPIEVANRGRAAGAALVEEQHAVVLERTCEPGLVDELERARRLASRPALEEDEPRQLVAFLLGQDDLAREDGQLAAFRARVVERQVELVLAEDEVRRTVGCDAHVAIMYRRGARLLPAAGDAARQRHAARVVERHERLQE